MSDQQYDIPEIPVNVFNPHEVEFTPELALRCKVATTAIYCLIYADRWGRHDLVEPFIYIDEEGEPHIAVKGPDYTDYSDEEFEFAADDAVYTFGLVGQFDPEESDAFAAMIDQMKWARDIGSTPTIESLFSAESNELRRNMGNERTGIDTSIGMRDIVLLPIRVPVAIADRVLSSALKQIRRMK